MNEIPCVFCGKYSDNIAIVENGYNGVKCKRCGLIFISPRPSVAEILNVYKEEHAVLYADAQFQFESFKRLAAASTLATISKHIESGSLLELGPGAGNFLKEARNRGYEPHGIELNPIEAQWISNELRIPCENVPLNESSFGGKQFDVVYHNDVLSHLHDPIGAFCDINRCLKKSGLLVFETGNIADVENNYYKYYSQFLYPDHLFFFGEKSLKLLLDRTGFKIVSIYRTPILLQLLLQKTLWGMKDSLKDQRVHEDMKLNQRFESKGSSLSIKRHLRLLYRYVGHCLIRLGGVLPKNGRPLKLLVVAEKTSEPTAVSNDISSAGSGAP